LVVAQEQPYYSSLPKKSLQARKRTRVYYIPRRERLMLTGLVLLVFCAAILVVYFYAQILIAGYQLNKMKKEINDLNIQTQAMTEDLARLASLERVEKVATTKLGMVKPDTGRMILVKTGPPVPNPDQASPEDCSGEGSGQAPAMVAQEKGNWIIRAFARLVAGRENPGQG
jgi:cell division protein FtsL